MKKALGLGRIATQADNKTAQDAAIAVLLGGLENQSKRVRFIVMGKLGDMRCDRALEPSVFAQGTPVKERERFKTAKLLRSMFLTGDVAFKLLRKPQKSAT